MTLPHRPKPLRALVAALCGLVVASSVPFGTRAQAAEPLPKELEGIDVQERLGDKVDRDLPFLDHRGEQVTLGDFLDGEAPVLMTLNYFRCETLCSVQLNQLLSGMKGLDWTAGQDGFRVVTVSFDPGDEPPTARGKRANYLKQLDRGDTVDWQFLTMRPGQDGTAKALADQLGFSYSYDAETKQYAHAPVVFALAPDGTISRYLYGITYEPKDLKFSLIEASEGRVGSTFEKILLSCFHYDSSRGDYTASAYGIMRLGGLTTLVVLGTFLGLMWLRERSRDTLESST